MTTRYAADLLEPLLGDEAASVAQRLVEDFPTHGYVICAQVAQELGLPIRAMAEYDLMMPLREVHRAAEDGNNAVQFLSLDAFLHADTKPETDSNEGDNDEEDPKLGPVGPEARVVGARDGSDVATVH